MIRTRWGGSLLEEARAPRLADAADRPPHTRVGAEPVSDVEVVPRVGAAAELDRRGARGSSTSGDQRRRRVAGRRATWSSPAAAGSARPRASRVIEELAELLGGAVGCSRAVTSAGWRPHSDQVGQTGTKIAPEIYIACGISGATQHMAGCKGAKRLLAINPDGEASIFASADYAVLGDLHEVVPAISAEIRKARGS